MDGRICIDPGHGMDAQRTGADDPGVVHVDDYGILHREADIVLRWGLTLAESLRTAGVATFLTRRDPADQAPQGRRGLGAMRLGCDLVVALHLAKPGARAARLRYSEPRLAGLAMSLAGALAEAIDETVGIAPVRGGEALLPGFDGMLLHLELGDLTHAEHRCDLNDPAVRALACEAMAAALLRRELSLVPAAAA
jgi:N-acetylmuramoyl-L-alanine amidase